MRDHHQLGRDIVVRCSARPINDAAAQALLDDEYRRKMVAYGR